MAPAQSRFGLLSRYGSSDFKNFFFVGKPLPSAFFWALVRMSTTLRYWVVALRIPIPEVGFKVHFRSKTGSGIFSYPFRKNFGFRYLLSPSGVSGNFRNEPEGPSLEPQPPQCTSTTERLHCHKKITFILHCHKIPWNVTIWPNFSLATLSNELGIYKNARMWYSVIGNNLKMSHQIMLTQKYQM